MKARKLKVYRSSQLLGPDGKQWEMIAAVHSAAEFSRLTGASARFVSLYCSETGNKDNVAAAMAMPHTLLGRHPSSTWYTEIRDWQVLATPRGGE